MDRRLFVCNLDLDGSLHIHLDTSTKPLLYTTQKFQFMVTFVAQLDVGGVQPPNCRSESPTQSRAGSQMLSALHGGHNRSLRCHRRETRPQHYGTSSRKECSHHHASC